MSATSTEIAAAVAEGLAPVVAALEKLTARLDTVLAPLEAKAAAEAEALALKAAAQAEATTHLDALGASEAVRAWFMPLANTRERLALLQQLKLERLEVCAGASDEIDFNRIRFWARLDEAVEWERQHPELVAEREQQTRKRRPRTKR